MAPRNTAKQKWLARAGLIDFLFGQGCAASLSPVHGLLRFLPDL